MFDSSAASQPPTLASLVQPYIVAFITILGSAVAAWFAGKASIKRESEKLRWQRSFELRLEWFKKVLTVLGGVQSLFRKIAAEFAETKPDEGKLELMREQLSEFEKPLHGTMRDALLFGSPETARALTNMCNEMAKKSSDGGLEVDRHEVGRSLEVAYLALVVDMRKHLGLEALTLEDMQVVFRET